MCALDDPPAPAQTLAVSEPEPSPTPAPPSRKVSLWRWMVAVAALLASGGGAAWLLMPLWPREPPPPPPPPPLVVAGTPLAHDGDVVANALDLVRRYARSELALSVAGGGHHPLTPATLGVEIDRARLAELVRAAGDSSSAMVQAHREKSGDAPLSVPLPLRVDRDRAVAALLSIKADVDRAASDAVVDLEKRELVPETMGFSLDVYATLARIDGALRGGANEVEAVGEVVRPRVVASQLANVAFDDVLGFFETRYSRSARHEARTYNLRLAASRLDGTVLLPGEEFDFNDVVGPRDEAHGYKVAPVIAQGELVDGIGGGTCQVSGTLHGAAFFAGLQIIERVPHSRPSSYIKLGMDAAVAYPTINFRMKNPFDHPVVLHETVKNGIVRAEILGSRRTHTVTFFRRIDEVIPFEEEVRETDDLPDGERVLGQRGIPGFKTTVYRIVRDGAYATRTKVRTEYPPTTQIVKLGTGGKTKRQLKEDHSLEYAADEYLVITQGPKKAKQGSEPSESYMVESRTPGRFGQKGWQKKLGLKVFENDEQEGDDDESAVAR